AEPNLDGGHGRHGPGGGLGAPPRVPRRAPSRRLNPRPPRGGTMAGMRVGISIEPPLATIPGLLVDEGVSVFQTVVRDPGCFGNYGVPEPADRAAMVEGLRGRATWGVAHGSLLINLASPEGRVRNCSAPSLLADL